MASSMKVVWLVLHGAADGADDARGQRAFESQTDYRCKNFLAHL